MQAVRTDPMVGVVLDARYTIVARVAVGGMSTVYEALDARLDRAVAVKVMHPMLAADADFVARFTREARAAARVSHPHVVAVHDQGSDAATGAVFLVMELVRGRTVRELLQQRGRLTAAEALDLLEPVASALAAAHRAGLVHRDVKPENVLLGDDGRVLVADFGLARAVEASQVTAAAGLLIGTVAYLAPESVSSGAADARSDVYSAGVLLSELVTGAPPYDGDTPLSVAYRHLHEDVPSPRVHPGVDALVLSCTSRDPRSRLPDGAALLHAVRATRAALAGPRLTAPIPVPARHTEQLAPTFAPLPAPPRELSPGRGADASGGPVVVPRDGVIGARRAPLPPGLQPRRRRRAVVLVSLTLAALTAVAGGSGWWLGYGRWTSAPSVVSLAPAAARAAVGGENLLLRDEGTVASDAVPAGQVAEQVPPAGTRLHRGEAVRVKVSSGPRQHTVPAVRVGTPPAAAGAALRAAGLGIGPTRGEYDDRVRSGGLLRLEPPAGSRRPTGTPVTLILSQGPRPVPVPPVVGRGRQEALAALAAAHLTGSVTEVFSDSVPPGQVVSQDTAPGTPVLPASAVLLQVSKGPEIVTLPRIGGRQLTDVQRDLQALGLRVEVLRVPGGPGYVFSSDPRGGSRVRAGSTVRLSVV